ncbi:hypothetical protein BV25DRAFT_1595392 [Artomyces pyxidatus]|uniref:Uncharacterized protein n=1 Tax=Artomyces pyxidatus TaxID=48021 RepID=A0ACB8TB37_9AGAM|nr:hypothetical protein BV25DRAFT_1595392 [Artomyces pyxidatus]
MILLFPSPAPSHSTISPRASSWLSRRPHTCAGPAAPAPVCVPRSSARWKLFSCVCDGARARCAVPHRQCDLQAPLPTEFGSRRRFALPLPPLTRQTGPSVEVHATQRNRVGHGRDARAHPLGGRLRCARRRVRHGWNGLRGVQYYVIDFNQTGAFDRLHDPVDVLVEPFFTNDPYYPRPRPGEALYSEFRCAYVAACTEDLRSRGEQFLVAIEVAQTERDASPCNLFSPPVTKTPALRERIFYLRSAIGFVETKCRSIQGATSILNGTHICITGLPLRPNP